MGSSGQGAAVAEFQMGTFDYNARERSHITPLNHTCKLLVSTLADTNKSDSDLAADLYGLQILRRGSSL